MVFWLRTSQSPSLRQGYSALSCYRRFWICDSLTSSLLSSSSSSSTCCFSSSAPTSKSITSATNPLVKRLTKLRQDADFRRQEKSSVISGTQIISELCASPAILPSVYSAPAPSSSSSSSSSPIIAHNFLYSSEHWKLITSSSLSQSLPASPQSSPPNSPPPPRLYTLQSLHDSSKTLSLSASSICSTSPDIISKISGLSNCEGWAVAELPIPLSRGVEQVLFGEQIISSSSSSPSSSHSPSSSSSSSSSSPSSPNTHSPNSPRYLLLVDSVADPGNLGTLVRTALALGWHGVILPRDSASSVVDVFNDKCIRASKGAVFRLPHTTCSWQDLTHALLSSFPSSSSPPPPASVSRTSSSSPSHSSVSSFASSRLLCFLADADGAPLSSYNDLLSRSSPLPHSSPSTSLSSSSCSPIVLLVLSNETRGPSSAALRLPNILSVSISMHNNFESLNVAVAGGILMYHLKNSL